jgi:hypothetical protein
MHEGEEISAKDINKLLKEVRKKGYNFIPAFIDKSIEKKPKLECSVCSEQFSSVTNLNRHSRSKHSSEKITCSGCGLEYSRIDGLQRHKKLCTL